MSGPLPPHGHGHRGYPPAGGAHRSRPPAYEQPIPPQYAPPTPPPPAPRKRRVWPWVTLAAVALIVTLGAIGSGGDTSSTTAAPSSSSPAGGAPAAPAEAAATGTDTITYEVTGDGVSKANNITYVKDSNFGQQQENAAKLPWRKDVEMDAGLFDLQPMTLVAQSASGKSGGSITCRILRNGEEVTSSTSSGPYAVVTCSGGIG